VSFRDFFEVLAYLLPGFVAYEIYASQVQPRRRTGLEFTLVSLILSLSVLFVTKSAGRLFRIPYLDVPFSELNKGVTSYRQLIWLLGVAICLGFVVAILDHRNCFSYIADSIISLGTAGRRRAHRGPTVWVTVLPQAEGRWVVVRTISGPSYIGFLEYFSRDPRDPTQEVFLSAASLINEETGDVQRDIVGPGVLLERKNIASIEIWNQQSESTT
jgi:hypothetical protein